MSYLKILTYTISIKDKTTSNHLDYFKIPNRLKCEVILNY